MPTHFKALFNRGFAYDKLGQFDLAIKDYSTAISIEPKNAFTYYNKGISLDRRGDYDLAIESFTQINFNDIRRRTQVGPVQVDPARSWHETRP
jgi:lipoprotein NlpI